VPLGLVAGRWTGSHAVSTPTVEQYFVQVVDDANNVSVSSKKGQDFEAPAQPAAGAPTITLSGTPVGGTYVGPQQVTITSDGPLDGYRLDAGALTPYTGPFVVAAPGAHTVVASGPGGNTSSTFTILTPPGPIVSISSPASGTSYAAGDPIPGVFSCSGFEVRSCSGTPSSPDSTLGTHTFTVTATDSGGRTGTASVTYTVRSSPFVGFLPPIADGPGSTPSVIPKGIPVLLRFRLVESSGAPIPDRTSLQLARSCDARLSYTVASGPPGTPVQAGCFVYDPFFGHEFDFLLDTRKLTAGTSYLLRVHFTSGWVPDHTVQIKIR
jgi:hypothetical protein